MLNCFNRKTTVEIIERLDRIEQLLIHMKGQIVADLTQLQADVTNETSVDQSAIALITGLAAAVTAAGTDPVALKAVTDQMEANAAALAAAVSANTPPAAAPAQ